MKRIRKIAGTVLTVVFCAVVSGCINSKTQTVAEMPVGDRLQIGWGKRSIAAPGNVPITGQSNLRIALGEYSPVLVSAMAMIHPGSQTDIIGVVLFGVVLAIQLKKKTQFKKER